MGNSNSTMAFIVPRTAPAPHISNFISSIPLPGLREIPPVSNVIPLPTKATVCLAFSGKYSRKTIRPGTSDPLETPRNISIPSSDIFSSSKKLNFSFPSEALAKSCATCRRSSGVRSLGAVLPRSLVKLVPRAMLTPLSMESCEEF